jgi:hypothetical protein
MFARRDTNLTRVTEITIPLVARSKERATWCWDRRRPPLLRWLQGSWLHLTNLSLAMAGVLACWRWLQGSRLNCTNLSPAMAGEDACCVGFKDPG